MLDRLIDPESGGTLARAGYSIEQMIAAVRRDLEELMNTRLGIVDFPAGVSRDPSFAGRPMAFPISARFPPRRRSSRNRSAAMIEETIDRFEPRLRDVQVHLTSESRGGTQIESAIPNRSPAVDRALSRYFVRDDRGVDDRLHVDSAMK